MACSGKKSIYCRWHPGQGFGRSKDRADQKECRVVIAENSQTDFYLNLEFAPIPFWESNELSNSLFLVVNSRLLRMDGAALSWLKEIVNRFHFSHSRCFSIYMHSLDTRLGSAVLMLNWGPIRSN